MSAEKTYNSTSSFLNNCLATFISLAKVVLKSKSGIRLPKADSERCIVLGNGPSLKTSFEKHPTFFKKHPLICVNSFSITKEYEELKPTYYIILDPGFWNSENEIIVNAVNSIKSKTNWKLYLLVPFAAKKSKRIMELEKQNSNIKLIFFNYTVYSGFKNIGNFLFKQNMAMPQSQNVLVASLFLSINIGFKEIYLLGADHSWHENLLVDDKNRLCFKDSHFYDNAGKITYRLFLKTIDNKETFTMSEILFTFGKIFRGYERMNDYANYRGSKIYNSSEVSFVDAFERKKLDKS